MPSSTTFSSNAIETLSNSMAYPEGLTAEAAGFSLGNVGAGIAYLYLYLYLYLYPKIAKINLVTKKSTIRISTEEATTAWVVERPTPCVPPRVDMP